METYTLDNLTALVSLHAYSTLSSASDASLLGQMEERVALVRHWDIKPGERVLEVGGGQGDCTIALAAAVGEQGHVTALDPGALDYGRPINLGDAQKFLNNGPFGSRITFVQATPLDFLSSAPAGAPPTYDTAVLAQSAWYFASPAELRDTLAALARVARRVCIAEYALAAASPRAAPHVLAAFALGALAVRQRATDANIRTLLSPAQLAALAGEAGLRIVDGSARNIAAPEAMHDGRWEVGAVLAPGFEEDVKRDIEEERERALVLAMRDSVRAAKEALPEGTKVATMDIWAAQFVSA